MSTYDEHFDEEIAPPDPERVIDNLDEEEILVATGELTHCPDCGGEGEVLTRFAGSKPIGYDYDMTACTRCNSGGWVLTAPRDDMHVNTAEVSA